MIVTNSYNKRNSNGKKEGYWKYYSASKKLIAAGNYSNDVPIGFWEEYKYKYWEVIYTQIYYL